MTPLDGAFTKPVASATLGGLLEEKGVELVTEFNTGEVDGPGGRLSPTTVGRSVSTSPSSSPSTAVLPMWAGHQGSATNSTSCPPTSTRFSPKPGTNVFVIGDAANLPVSKAGSVTHFEGEVLVENIRRFLAGEPLDASFDGHANCFIESGFHKALLIDFNYDTEPLPGHFPTTRRSAAAQRVATSTIWASSCSSPSTGTACCPVATFPASARPCLPGANIGSRRDHDRVL